MKFVSFNINGLRARYHQLEKIKNILKADVIGLQETKVHDLFFPIEKISILNYKVYFYGKKQYAGVALLSNKKPIEIRKGFEKNNIDKKCRVIIADYITSYGKLTVINCYVPNGENIFNIIKYNEKKIFLKDLENYLKNNYDCNNSLILIMGDMNIAVNDIDIGIGKNNYKRWLYLGKCGFLQEEKEWIKKIFNLGFVDTYRYKNSEKKNNYSWFDYRYNSFNKNCGLRIDLLLASRPLAALINNTGIDYSIRAMEKPSDHAPVWVDFNLDIF